MSVDNPFEVSSGSYGDRSGKDRDVVAAEVSTRTTASAERSASTLALTCSQLTTASLPSISSRLELMTLGLPSLGQSRTRPILALTQRVFLSVAIVLAATLPR